MRPIIPITVVLIRRLQRVAIEDEDILMCRLLQRIRFRRRYLERRGPYCAPFFNRRVYKLITLHPQMLKKQCRLRPTSFRVLMQLLESVDNGKHHGYALQFSVIVTLFWLAAGTSYRVTGMVFDVARSTVCELTTTVLNLILRVANRVIHKPTEEELPAIGMNFQRMAGSPAFSQCVGAIDGTHIRTLCPDVARTDEYINRKLFYSFNMQGLVDHRGRFVDICVGFPGSCHDMRVLKHSGLYREGSFPPRGYFIVGDGGYTCLRDPITIIVPYRNVRLTPAQLSFNYHLSKARVIVEQAFGLLDARWRMLFHRALEVKPVKAVKVMTSCCVLHNLCIDSGDILEHAPYVRPRQLVIRGQAGGEAYRNIICLAHNVARLQAEVEHAEVQ